MSDYTHADLVILVPVLRRPHRVQPLLDSIEATVPGCRVIFVCSTDDTDQITACCSAQAPNLRVEVVIINHHTGDYARKILVGYLMSQEPLIFCGADDLLFHPGWFEAATAKLTEGIGVVGTNDLTNPRVMKGDHSTHSLMTRDYIDKHGTIDSPFTPLHMGYEHEHVDDECIGTAKYRRAWAFAGDAHVEHLHPMAGKAPMDEMYAAQDQRMAQSGPIFRRRQRRWGGR